MKNTNIDLQIALEEMRSDFQNSLDSGDIIDKKLNQILIASGIILSIASLINLFEKLEKINFASIVYILVIILYFVTIILALFGSRPMKYKRPITAEWNELDKDIFNQPEREIYLKLLSGYVDQISNNRRINWIKSKIYFVCLILLSINFLILSLIIIFK